MDSSSSTPRLDVYTRTRNPSQALRRAKAISNCPDREVHPLTSAIACNQCREEGLECVTAPNKKHCVFCIAHSGKYWWVCSTLGEREKGAERKRERDEIECWNGEDENETEEVEEEEEEEDQMEGLEENGRTESDEQ